MAISQYSQPLQSLNQPGITPLPFDEMLKAGQYIQKRYDDSVLATEDQYTKVAESNIIDAQKAALDSVKANFSKEMSNLMDKYKGQTYSSDFQRDSRKLISQMASDPTVKLLKENKAQFEYDDAMAREMKAKGIEYYDPRLNGLNLMNPDGTPVKYQAGVRALKYDNLIDEQGAKILQAMTQEGATSKNFNQLNQAISAAIKPSSEIFKDKVASLKQQGYTDKDAAKVATQYITERFNSFKRSGIDAGILNYNLNKEQAAAKAANNIQQPMPLNPRGAGAIPATSTNASQAEKAEAVAKGESTFSTWYQKFYNAVQGSYTNAALGGVLAYGGPDQRSVEGERQKVLQDAKNYFGDNVSSKFKTPEALAGAYAKALRAHDAETSEVLLAPSNNDVNDAIKNYLAKTNFKVTELGPGGKVVGNPGQAGFNRTPEGLKATEFLGVSTTDPTDNATGVSFRFKQSSDKYGEKEYSITLDPKALPQSLIIAGQLGNLKKNSSQVVNRKTNMLSDREWVRDVDNTGNAYTFIPIRTFTEDGIPSYKVAKVAGHPTLLEGNEAIENLQKMPKSYQNQYLFDSEAIKESAIQQYFGDNAEIAPGLKTIDFTKPQ